MARRLKKPNSRIVFVNGKFLTYPTTGVQRVAAELLHALDAELQADASVEQDVSFIILAPLKALELSLNNISTILYGKLPPNVWEQFLFPVLSQGFLCLNLCNTGPIVRRNSVTMIHDAQVYLSPKSYSVVFRLWYRLLLPWLGRANRKILTVSEYSKAQLVSFGVARAAKIHVVPNGVDHMLRVTADVGIIDRFGLPPKGYVVGLANAQAHKNVRRLIDAFKDPRLSGLTLALFGKATADDFGPGGAASLPPNVKFLGPISDPELRGLIENALCLGFPSKTEGFGLPALEAMTLQCATVVAPCGALPEVCGEAVLYADPDDSEPWITAFRRIKDDSRLRSELQAKGAAQASKYTWKVAAVTLLACVRSELMTKRSAKF